MLTYKIAIALRPQICDVTSPYFLFVFSCFVCLLYWTYKIVDFVSAPAELLFGFFFSWEVLSTCQQAVSAVQLVSIGCRVDNNGYGHRLKSLGLGLTYNSCCCNCPSCYDRKQRSSFTTRLSLPHAVSPGVHDRHRAHCDCTAGRFVDIPYASHMLPSLLPLSLLSDSFLTFLFSCPWSRLPLSFCHYPFPFPWLNTFVLTDWRRHIMYAYK